MPIGMLDLNVDQNLYTVLFVYNDIYVVVVVVTIDSNRPESAECVIQDNSTVAAYLIVDDQYSRHQPHTRVFLHSLFMLTKHLLPYLKSH